MVLRPPASRLTWPADPGKSRLATTPSSLAGTRARADEAVLTLFRPPGRAARSPRDASVETRLVKLTEEAGEAAEAIIGAARPFSELRK
jgi:hypothetical protein